jgi:hypothetical protein
VFGLVKPGMGAETIVKSAMSYIVNLSKSDVDVFCGGSNDVSENKANVALKYISNCVKANNNTHIILLSAPHRHDLMDSSYVNKEIKSCNRKLMKHVKTVNHTKVLDIDPTKRILYSARSASKWAREGRGCQTNSSSTFHNSKEKVDEPISLGWESDFMKGDPSTVSENRNEILIVRENEINQVDTLDSEEIFPRISTRPKKTPVTRRNDFFMVNSTVADESMKIKRIRKKPVSKTNDFYGKVKHN